MRGMHHVSRLPNGTRTVRASDISTIARIVYQADQSTIDALFRTQYNTGTVKPARHAFVRFDDGTYQVTVLEQPEPQLRGVSPIKRGRCVAHQVKLGTQGIELQP